MWCENKASTIVLSIAYKVYLCKFSPISPFKLYHECTANKYVDF